MQPSTPTIFEVISPGRERLYVRVAEDRDADMDRAISAARKAFDLGPWPRTSHREQAGLLAAMCAKLTERADDLAQVWPDESGITYASAKARTPWTGNIDAYHASLAETFPFEKRKHPGGGGQIRILVPEHVVTVFIRWKAPILLMAYKIASALPPGCPVVVKLLPEEPGMEYIIAEIAAAAGLPPGVLTVVTEERGVSEQLVISSLVDKVSFIGSTAAGWRITSLSGSFARHWRTMAA